LRRPARHHQIVENAAAVIEQLRVADSVKRMRGDVGRRQLLEAFRRFGSFEERLTHMRDVEEAGSGARMQMLSENAGRILHRHVIAGEGNHARAKLDVQRVKRRLTQVG
jgi:CBS-domain-containing membrane protein